MIGYYIKKVKKVVDDVLTYILKPNNTISDGIVQVEPVPLDSKFNALNQTNSPFSIATYGDVSENTFSALSNTKINNIHDSYALKKFTFNLYRFNRAFIFVSPTTEEGYTNLIIKNNNQKYLLNYKGKPSSYYKLRKGDTESDVEFAVIRVSPKECIFLADKKDYTFEIYYSIEWRNPPTLFAEGTHFDNVPANYLFNNLVPTYDYLFRVRGKDPQGNYTEFSSTTNNKEDAFYLPLFENKDPNNYLPELQRITLDSNIVSIISYPDFETGLQMVGVEYNDTKEKLLRVSKVESIYATTSDDPAPGVNAEFEMFRFNTESSIYQNFLTQIQTTNLQERSQIELNAANGTYISEPFVIKSIKRTSPNLYSVEGSGSGELYIKNIDTMELTQKQVTLPYTFNHIDEQKFEFSIDNINWINAWGIYLNGRGAYLEALDSNELFLNKEGVKYRELKVIPMQNIKLSYILWRNTDIYIGGVESELVTIINNNQIWVKGDEFVSNKGAYDYNYEKYLVLDNVYKFGDNITLEPNIVDNTFEGKAKFNIGKEMRSPYGYRYSWKTVLTDIKLGTHVAKMTGVGTQVIDQNGVPFLNLRQGAEWVKI